MNFKNIKSIDELLKKASQTIGYHIAPSSLDSIIELKI